MVKVNPLVSTEDNIAKAARRFQHRAIATLMAVCEDEAAPASAKSQAAAKLLEIGYGRPGQARQFTLTDLAAMSQEQRQELFHVLVTTYRVEFPNQKAMMKAAVEEAWSRLSALPKPKKCHFRRGPLAGKGPEVPRWPTPARQGPAFAPAAASISCDSSANLEPEAPLHTAPSDLRSNSLVNRVTGNVVVMPGVERRPAPFGIKYRLDTDLAPCPEQWAVAISPDVVARSAFKDPLALDAAFNGFNSRRKRPW